MAGPVGTHRTAANDGDGPRAVGSRLLGWPASRPAATRVGVRIGRVGSPVTGVSRALPGMNPHFEHAPVVDVNLNEALLNAADVADLLKVPRSSVYEYARRQARPLPSIMIGRHRRFYRSDLEAWLAEQRQPRR